MDVNDFLTKILISHGEVQGVVRTLLKMLVLEHPKRGNHNNDPNIALSNILVHTPNLKDILRTFKINCNVFYDDSVSPPLIRPSINIDSLDSTAIFDILENIDGLMNGVKYGLYVGKNKKTIMQCADISTTHTGKCCDVGCSHLCKHCKKPICGKTCVGLKSGYECHACGETKQKCKMFSTVCCNQCNLCFRCGVQKTDELQCPNTKLFLGVDFAHSLRNLFGHHVKAECEDFLKSKVLLKGIRCKTPLEFKDAVIQCVKRITSFMSSESNFKVQSCMTEDEASKCVQNFILIWERDSQYLSKHFAESLISGYQDMKKGELNLEKLQHLIDIQEDMQNQLQNLLENFGKSSNYQDVRTDITRVTELASDTIKTIYRKKFSKLAISDAIRGEHPPKFVPYDQIIVDVTMKPNNAINATETVTLHDLLSGKFEFTLLSGAPGTGKTTFAKSLAYQWASQENNMQVYDFLFILSVRDLNRYKNKAITASEILKKEYPAVFNHIAVEDLSKNGSKVLIVIEGFDECSVYKEFNKPSKEDPATDYCNAMFDLLNPENPSMQFHRLVTCRQEIRREIEARYNDKVEVNNVELIGFSEEQIKQYIDKYFNESDDQLELVKKKFFEMEYTASLAVRPFFCWVFCSLLNEMEYSKMPTTLSAIHASMVVIFLRQHGNKQIHTALNELFDEELIKTISQLSRIAYHTIKSSRIIFRSEESGLDYASFHNAVKSSGLIEIHQNYGDLTEREYQFTHFSMHEFFCAFYVFLYDDLDDSFCSHNLTLHFIAGFMGGNLKDSRSYKLLKLFSGIKNTNTTIESCAQFLFYANDYNEDVPGDELLYEFENTIGELEANSLHYIQFLANSSYKENCLKHLLHYVVNHNQGIFPFRAFTINQEIISPKLLLDYLPYINQIQQLIIYISTVGFLQTITPFLVNVINLCIFCSDDVSQEDWSYFTDYVASIRPEMLMTQVFVVLNVRKDYMMMYERIETFDTKLLLVTSPLPPCINQIIPQMKRVLVEFDLPGFRTMLSTFDKSKRRIEDITAIMKSVEPFSLISNSFEKIKSLKNLRVLLVVTCQHDFSAPEMPIQNNIKELFGEAKTCVQCYEFVTGVTKRVISENNRISKQSGILEVVCPIDRTYIFQVQFIKSKKWLSKLFR